jgi:hypothetical protein
MALSAVLCCDAVSLPPLACLFLWYPATPQAPSVAASCVPHVEILREHPHLLLVRSVFERKSGRGGGLCVSFLCVWFRWVCAVLFGCLGGGWEGEESEIGGCCGDEWELHTMLPRRDCFVQETVAWIRAASPLWRACMCANACVHHSGKDAAWNHSWGIMWWIFSVPTVLLSLDFCYMTSFYPSSTVDHLHYVGGVSFVW